ncbi:hypothetical protein [Methanolobus chelungpuianus]|uniref:hypothetical protein n=1 Tax=Methanolobus chelungpuianus TaxID=502115 RepID=UPI0021148CDD|nr:hypothetical protein [Methanolobus chelungpuianus]
MKKNHILYTLTVFLLLTFSSTSGCIDTPAAPAAFADKNALDSYGWSQVGTVEQRTIEQKITTSTSVSFNSTIVKYRNDRLEKDIESQVQEFRDQYRLPDSFEAPYITSEVQVNRITLPAGVRLPGDMMNRILESKSKEMSSENNIDGLRSSGTRQITLKNGLTVPVYTYEGNRGSGNESLGVIAIITAYESEESSTIITGIVPNGSMSVSLGPVNGTLYTIDGERELQEMLKLISTIQ